VRRSGLSALRGEARCVGAWGVGEAGEGTDEEAGDGADEGGGEAGARADGGDAGGADQASLRLRLGEFGSKVSDSAERGVFGLLDQSEHGQTNREGAGAERAGERRSLLGLGEFSPGSHELRFRRGGLRDLIELDAVEQSRADQLARR